MKGSQITLIALILIVLGFVFWGVSQNGSDQDTTDGTPIDTSTWRTYENQEFGFRIQYPPHWRVAAFPDNEIQPAFNFYQGGAVPTRPLIHHDARTHVSVYPEGVPTEGLFGSSVPSTVDFTEPVRQAIDFVTEAGERWATFVYFEDPPTTVWSEAGFVFARAPIENLDEMCLRDGVEVTSAECDPLFGDTIVRSGMVDQEVREIERLMLESFEFLEGATSTADLIRVTNPQPNQIISSPLTVRGEARGNWYFEASFPIDVVDWDGRIIGQGIATAEGEWMTTEFVPFEATITFTSDTTVSDRGAVIFRKDNPSGLPEHDDALEIPVRFEP